MKSATQIPGYVADWTDKYFHRSCFDVPLGSPSKRVVQFLSRFKKPVRIKLYRGINQYNEDSKQIVSWTHEKEVAKRYAQEAGGKIIEREFSAGQILLDTTALVDEEKKQLGYDYIIDDKEVLIMF